MKDIREQLTKYLTDAHSIEEQSLQQLRRAPEIAGEVEFAQALREHLEVTESHERRVRALLEERGAKPSHVKDAVMRAGGSGFVLFAQSQSDTPGKLAAHALSYEALEWASYDLLARTADRGGEFDVAAVARGIRDEERAMMQRIEGLFDRTVDASLNAVDGEGIEERLRSYLKDAHAIEAQSIQLLELGSRLLKDEPALAGLFREHLLESRRQQTLLKERLEAHGAESSLLKDVALRMAAAEWATFFRAHPDTAGKLTGFAYALEHLEIGAYEQLRRVAERAADSSTAETVGRIITEERHAADRLAGAFDQAVAAALVEQGVH